MTVGLPNSRRPEVGGFGEVGRPSPSAPHDHKSPFSERLAHKKSPWLQRKTVSLRGQSIDRRLCSLDNSGLANLCHVRADGVIFWGADNEDRWELVSVTIARTANPCSPTLVMHPVGSRAPWLRFPPITCGLSQNTLPRHCGGGLISDIRYPKSDWNLILESRFQKSDFTDVGHYF